MKTHVQNDTFSLACENPHDGTAHKPLSDADFRRVVVIAAIVLSVFWLLSLIVAFIALGSIAAPFASNCVTSTVAFRPDTTVDVAMGVAGKRSCTLAIKRGDATIESLSIETPPGAGRITARGRLGVVYEPPHDFTGRDSFALAMRGRLNSESGIMRIRVAVGK